MNQKEFALRLALLRMQKGVAAQSMSELIGQNHGYIQNIESGKSLPSMAAFFRICEYLDITPAEFFDTGNANPTLLREIIDDLKRLDAKQLEIISSLIQNMIGSASE